MLKIKSKRVWATLLTLILLAAYSSTNLSVVRAAGSPADTGVDLNPGDDSRSPFRMGTVRLNGSSGGMVTNDSETGAANLYMFFELTSLNAKDPDSNRRLNQAEDIKGEFYFYLFTNYDENDSNLSDSESVDYVARNIVYVFDPVRITAWNDIPADEQQLYINSESKQNDMTKNNTLVGICNEAVDITSFGTDKLYLSVYFKADDDCAYRSKHSKFRRPITINTVPVADPPTVDPVTSPIMYGESASVDVTAHSTSASSGTLDFYVEGTLLISKPVTVGITERIEIDSQYLKGVGSYDIIASFTPDGSTTAVESTESFDVLPRPITLKPDDVTLKLGASLPSGYVWQVTAGNLVFDDELQGIIVTPDITDTTTPQTGNLNISQQDATVSPNLNYDITFESGRIEVVGVNTPPTITNVTHDKIITNQDIPVTFLADDTETPRKDLVINVYEGTDKDPAKEITSTNDNGNCTFTATKNGVYTLVVTDEEGESAETTVTIDTIDRIHPTLNPVPDNTESTSKPVTVTINAKDTADEGAADDTPGIQTTVVTDSSNNPMPVTDGKFTVDKNGTYIITVTDKAGNSTSTTIVIKNISDEPSTEEPSTEEPSTEEPPTEEPSTEEPSTEEPPTEEPSTEEPSTEEPSTEAPSTEAPNDDDDDVEDEPETPAASVPNNTVKTYPVTGDTTPILFLTVILLAAILTLGCTIVSKINDKETE